MKSFFTLRENTQVTEAVRVSRKDFDKLKKGSMITIDYGSGIRGSTKRTFMVKGKSRSAKYNVDKVNMVDPNKPGGMTFHLYSRNGEDATLALGDMGATINSYSIKESVELEEKDVKVPLELLKLYNKGMALPAGSIEHKKVMKQIDDMRKKLGMKEEVELDEMSREDKIKQTIKIMKKYPANKGKSERELRKGAIAYLDQKKESVELDENQTAFTRKELEAGNITIRKDKNGWRYLVNKSKGGAMGPYRTDIQVRTAIMKIQKESVEEKRDAGKSATGYDIYHDTYAAAMQHAYAHAKKKHGVTVRPSEIDDKVAMGPKKPSSGKTVSHILKTDKKQNLHVQVYNTGRKYELNMYVESVNEAPKVPDGMKFLGAYEYKDANGKYHSHRHYSKGGKMTSPVVVYIDDKEWETFQSFTKARKAAINHIKGMKESVEEAKVRGADAYDKTFANRKQADKFAREMGGRVKQVGRVFYVFKEDVDEATILRTKTTRKQSDASKKKDKEKAVKTFQDIRKGKYPGVKIGEETLDEASIQDIQGILATIAKSQNMNQAVQMVVKKYKVDQGKAKAMVKKAIDSGVTYDKIKKKYGK